MSAPERVALAGVFHRAAPDEINGGPIDWLHLCDDDDCLLYRLADAALAAGWSHPGYQSTDWRPE